MILKRFHNVKSFILKTIKVKISRLIHPPLNRLHNIKQNKIWLFYLFSLLSFLFEQTKMKFIYNNKKYWSAQGVLSRTTKVYNSQSIEVHISQYPNK
jgi:hypothetical protein